MPYLSLTIRFEQSETIGDVARRLRALADRMELYPKSFQSGADPVPVDPANPQAGSASVVAYIAGQRRILKVDQTDDDDGTERVTPAGSIVEILDVTRDSPNPYTVGCPETGGTWFFTAAELDAETDPV